MRNKNGEEKNWMLSENKKERGGIVDLTIPVSCTACSLLQKWYS
jgi:hypothetical protein